jgi:hypothetical protein
MDASSSFGSVAGVLWAAWSGLPKRDLVPDRADFNPMAIGPVLPVVSLIETENGSDWRIRLTGTEIDRRNGFSLTGREYLSLMSDEARLFYAGVFGEIVGRPCASWEIRQIVRASGGVATIEVLRVPLRAADGEVRLILSTNEEITPTRCLPGSDKLALPDSVQSVLLPRQHTFIDLGAGVPSPAEFAAAA